MIFWMRNATPKVASKTRGKMAGDCWINTRRGFSDTPYAYLDIIRNTKAAVLGHPNAEQALRRASEHGAYVFLYQNPDPRFPRRKIGIIAAGIATKEVGDDGRDPEHRWAYLKLSKFVHGVDLQSGVERVFITPAELRGEFGRSFFFANAIVPLSEENAKRLWKKCEKIFSA